jgi:nucleoid DNA-binding protein
MQVPEKIRKKEIVERVLEQLNKEREKEGKEPLDLIEACHAIDFQFKYTSNSIKNDNSIGLKYFGSFKRIKKG